MAVIWANKSKLTKNIRIKTKTRDKANHSVKVMQGKRIGGR